VAVLPHRVGGHAGVEASVIGLEEGEGGEEEEEEEEHEGGGRKWRAEDFGLGFTFYHPKEGAIGTMGEL
jgi:hypothetical protein